MRKVAMLTENQLNLIGQWQKKAWKLGLGGTAIALVGGIASTLFSSGDTAKIFEPFIMSYILWFGLCAGCLAAVMLHHLAGGAWSFMIQRICEAGSRTMPFFFVLGLIVLVGGVWLSDVYPWTDQAFLDEYHIVQNKVLFLNPKMFTLCFFAYFLVLGTLSHFFNKWSLQLDQTGDQTNIARMMGLSAPGLILYVLTMTLLATHWAMSLEPEWFSTMYAPWLIANYNLTVIPFAIILLSTFASEKPISDAITSRHYHHLGNLMFGFTIFWTYVSFSQFLIIWNGNLPEEIGWYLHRSGGTLNYVIALLAFGAWLTPMFLLIIKQNKMIVPVLRKVAFLVIAMRVVDIYFNLAPSFRGSRHDIDFVLVALYLAAIVGIGGFFLYFFFEQLKKRPLLPQQDPRRELHFLKDTAHHAHHA
jgi:hypothetical protein